MEKIDLDAKTDRELLVMVVMNQNSVCEAIKKQNKTLYGNGWPGLVLRVAMLTVAVMLLAMDNPKVQALLIALLK